jgi:cytochrome c5
MKLLVPGCLFLLVASLACQKKSVPEITGRKTTPPVSVAAQYPPAATVAPDTIQGKAVFMARCNRCHGIPDPHQYTSARWELILASMLPRTRISNDNAVHVRAWVLANATKN